MASRKEEKERLRAQRLAAEQSETGAARRRLLIGYAVAGVLGVAVLAGLVVVIASSGGGGDSGSNACTEAYVQAQSGVTHGLEFDCRKGTEPTAIQIGDLTQAAQKAGCELKLDLPDEGNSHVPDSTAVQYKTDPPASGNHNPQPLADGAYATPLSYDTSGSPNVRNLVHALEHGRVEVQYSPKLPEDQQLAIKGVFDEDPDGMLLIQNSQMPYAVAVTAWTQLVGCPKYTPEVIDVIRDFRDSYRGNGPEAQVPVSL
ncbi:MAG: DUF3105 domain-containing protein [Solirubrobacterales bacterium]